MIPRVTHTHTPSCLTTFTHFGHFHLDLRFWVRVTRFGNGRLQRRPRSARAYIRPLKNTGAAARALQNHQGVRLYRTNHTGAAAATQDHHGAPPHQVPRLPRKSHRRSGGRPLGELTGAAAATQEYRAPLANFNFDFQRQFHTLTPWSTRTPQMVHRHQQETPYHLTLQRPTGYG